MLLASVSPMLSWISATPPPAMRNSLHVNVPLHTVRMNLHATDLVHHSHETHEVQDRIIKLTKAMRRSELREGAAAVVAEMEAIDLRAVVREAETSSKRDQQALASAVAENTRLTLALEDSMNESMELRRDNFEMASKMAALRRTNDKLSTIVRHTSNEYQIGMTFMHSLSLCLAHGSTALIAARADIAWQLRRVGFRVQDFVGVVLYRSLVLRVRAMLTIGRLLESWKDGKKQLRAGLADPQR